MNSEVTVLGGISVKLASPQVLHALKECLRLNGMATVVFSPLKMVYRVEVRGKLCYSRQYQRVKKRNSFTIVYLDCTGLNKFALIDYFVFASEHLIAVLIPLYPSPCFL